MKIRRRLSCPKCGKNKFIFRMIYDKKEEMGLILGHDGFGFQFEDSLVECVNCKRKKKYNNFGLLWKEEK
jgi:hypothetical protein